MITYSKPVKNQQINIKLSYFIYNSVYVFFILNTDNNFKVIFLYGCRYTFRLHIIHFNFILFPIYYHGSLPINLNKLF